MDPGSLAVVSPGSSSTVAATPPVAVDDGLDGLDGQDGRPMVLWCVRKNGRCDYMRFDNCPMAPLRAGSREIGKVKIDCRYILDKSQWGVMGQFGKEKPAGIMYMDIDFRQPGAYTLDSATVRMRLMDTDGTETRDRAPNTELQFTDCYGPKSLRGEETVKTKTKSMQFAPEAQAAGFGAGLGSAAWGSEKQQKRQWSFEGSLASAEKDSPCYDCLDWTLEPNKDEQQPSYSNVFHTGSAFYHNGKKLFMAVQIDGQLQSSRQRAKEAAKRCFRFNNKKRDSDIVTKFEWIDGRYPYSRRLDPIAQSLPYTMVQENLNHVPTLVPPAQPATFHPVDPEPGPDSDPDSDLDLDSEPHITPPPQTQLPGHVLGELMALSEFDLDEPPATLPPAVILTPPVQENGDGEVSSPSSSGTLVGSTVTTEVESSGSSEANPETHPNESEDEVNVPGLKQDENKNDDEKENEKEKVVDGEEDTTKGGEGDVAKEEENTTKAIYAVVCVSLATLLDRFWQTRVLLLTWGVLVGYLSAMGRDNRPRIPITR